MWSKFSAGLQIVQDRLDHVLEDVSFSSQQVNWERASGLRTVFRILRN